MRCPALNKIQPLAQYHAFIPSLGIHTTNSALCLTHTGVLILKERGGLVSGGDSFEIKDGDGRGVMMVKGRGLKGELKETKGQSHARRNGHKKEEGGKGEGEEES